MSSDEEPVNGAGALGSSQEEAVNSIYGALDCENFGEAAIAYLASEIQAIGTVCNTDNAGTVKQKRATGKVQMAPREIYLLGDVPKNHKPKKIKIEVEDEIEDPVDNIEQSLGQQENESSIYEALGYDKFGEAAISYLESEMQKIGMSGNVEKESTEAAILKQERVPQRGQMVPREIYLLGDVPKHHKPKKIKIEIEDEVEKPVNNIEQSLGQQEIESLNYEALGYEKFGEDAISYLESEMQKIGMSGKIEKESTGADTVKQELVPRKVQMVPREVYLLGDLSNHKPKSIKIEIEDAVEETTTEGPIYDTGTENSGEQNIEREVMAERMSEDDKDFQFKDVEMMPIEVTRKTHDEEKACDLQIMNSDLEPAPEAELDLPSLTPMPILAELDSDSKNEPKVAELAEVRCPSFEPNELESNDDSASSRITAKRASSFGSDVDALPPVKTLRRSCRIAERSARLMREQSEESPSKLPKAAAKEMSKKGPGNGRASKKHTIDATNINDSEPKYLKRNLTKRPIGRPRLMKNALPTSRVATDGKYSKKARKE